jgi:hypothetical protein
MKVDHPLTSPALRGDALVDSAMAGALALLAYGVAALAFVVKSEWYLSGSLIGAAIWSLVAVKPLVSGVLRRRVALTDMPRSPIRNCFNLRRFLRQDTA